MACSLSGLESRLWTAISSDEAAQKRLRTLLYPATVPSL